MIPINDLKEKIINKIKIIIKAVLSIILAKLLPIILICCIAILLISAISYYIFVDDGIFKKDDWSNTGFVVSELGTSNVSTQSITQTTNGVGYCLGQNLDEITTNIIEMLKSKNGILDKYISPSKQQEYLKAFIKAELITQYPDLRSKDKIGTKTESNELQGCIQIHRASPDATDGETELLEYIDYNTFTSYIESNNEIATQYFSLDEQENLVIVGWTRITTNVDSNINGVENIDNNIEYTLNKNIINYKSLVKSYTMPFDFLWALTVIGEDEDFAYEVAKLALNSTIKITVQDNLNTTISNTLEEYNTKEKLHKSFTVTTTVDGTNYSKYVEKTDDYASEHYYTETIIKSEYCRTNVDITYADTWLFTYINSYLNNIPDEQTSTNVNNLHDDTDFTVKETGYWLTDTYAQQVLHDFEVEKCGGTAQYNAKLNSGNVSGTVGTVYYTKYSKTINRKNTNTVITSSNSYIKGTPNIKEKTDKNSDKPNFVTLFKKYQTANKNITSVSSWLFEILEGSEKTSDMVDVVKYLLYKATGKNYGKTEYDFSIFNQNSFATGITESGHSGEFDENLTKQEFIQMVTSRQVNGYGQTGRSRQEGYQKYFVNYAETFYDMGKKYNINPMWIFCVGLNESEFGTSNICVDKNNAFGYGAVDGSAYESAYTFSSMAEGIEAVMQNIRETFMNPDNWKYKAIVEKGYNPTTIEGVGTLYASDGSWAQKALNFMAEYNYIPESLNSVIDLNYENLSEWNQVFLNMANQCANEMKPWTYQLARMWNFSSKSKYNCN